jgi:hypothetical protein
MTCRRVLPVHNLEDIDDGGFQCFDVEFDVEYLETLLHRIHLCTAMHNLDRDLFRMEYEDGRGTWRDYAPGEDEDEHERTIPISQEPWDISEESGLEGEDVLVAGGDADCQRLVVEPDMLGRDEGRVYWTCYPSSNDSTLLDTDALYAKDLKAMIEQLRLAIAKE